MGGLSHTVSGNIASFRTPSRVPLESLKFHFLPKQEGSGDPSPTNVRPITGWTGVNGRRAGKNLFKFETGHTKQEYLSNGSNLRAIYHTGIVSDGRKICISATPKDPESITNANINIGYCRNGITYTYATFITTTGVTNVIAEMSAGDEITLNNTDESIWGIETRNLPRYDIQIEIAEEPTEFVAYSGEQIPITFPDGQTFYGGYIDPVAGEIVATHAKCTVLWGEGGTNLGSVTRQTLKLPFVYKTGEELHDSGQGPYRKRTSCDILTWRFDYYADSIHYYIHGQYAYAFLPSDTQVGTEIEFCAELATPIHIPISAQDLKTFLDHNNFWSDANDITEVTYPVTESKDILAIRKKIIVNEPHIESANGTIAHFVSDSNLKVKSLKFHFAPYLSGSGAASPANKREIKGFTGVRIDHSGKNMLKCDGYTGDGLSKGVTYTKHTDINGNIDYITISGRYDGSNNAFRNLSYGGSHVQKLPRGIISMNSFCDHANIMPVGDSGAKYTALDGGGIYAERNGWFDYDTSEIQPDYGAWTRIQIWPNGQEDDVDSVIYPMMTHQSDRGCQYEAYHGDVINITWENDYGTIYGGYIDLLRGWLVQEYAIVSLDTFNSSWYEESSPSGMFVLQNEIEFTDRTKLFCDSYKTVAYTYWNDMPNLTIMGHPSNNKLLRIRDTSYAGNLAGFKANLTSLNAKLVYPVTIPVLHYLTPQQMKTFIGTNNIWSNLNGKVEVSYWTH